MTEQEPRATYQDLLQKLSTLERYRLRQGDWRIVYEIEDQGRLVTVVKIGNRREIHRRD